MGILFAKLCRRPINCFPRSLFLDKVVNEVYELSRKNDSLAKLSKYLELKAEQLASEWKAYEKQQEEINKLEDFVAKNLVRASTTKRTKSKSIKMDRLDRPKEMKNRRIFFR